MSSVRPEDFYGEYPPERIMGAETEYVLQAGPLYNGSLRPFFCKENFAKAGIKIHSDSANHWLYNGGLVYVDVNSHPEYATPECLGPREAAAAELVGVAIMQKLVETSKAKHNGLFRSTGSILFDRETQGYKVVTSGQHQSYLIPRTLVQESELLEGLVASDLASRIWAMTGTVRDKFILSQKVFDIGGKPFDNGLKRRTNAVNKPMASIPEDADIIGDGQDDWARLEVRYADAGLSPTVRYLSFAMSSLVLRLAEHADMFKPDELRKVLLARPVTAAHTFAEDLSQTTTEVTQTEQRYSALDLQEKILELLHEMSERVDIPRDERTAIEIMPEFIDALRSSDLATADYDGRALELDFPRMHHWLARKFGAQNLDARNPAVAEAVHLWDRITPTGVAMHLQRNKGSNGQFVDLDERIDDLYTNPPRLTRASLRADYLSKAKSETSISWCGSSSCVDGNKVAWLDPYESA